MSQKRAKELRKAAKQIAATDRVPEQWKKIYKELKALTKNKFIHH